MTIPLDAIGFAAGTDKHALQNDYLSTYETAFARYRDLPITLIEIGVARGGSLRTWERYFSNATIVGIDINPECRTQTTDRSIVEIGSQADVQFITGIAGKHSPTIIIDDGSHRTDHIQITFEALFPLLLPGGCYVVEDIMNPHLPGSALRGDAMIDSPEYFLGMAKRTLLEIDPSPTPFDHYLRNAVVSVQFIGHAVFVWKRPPIDFDALEEMVSAQTGAWPYHHLAALIMKRGGPLELAERANRRAIALNPNVPSFHRLRDQLERLRHNT
jgi:hypothetical protein